MEINKRVLFDVIPIHELSHGGIHVETSYLDDVTIAKPIAAEELSDDDLIHATDCQFIKEQRLRIFVFP